MVVVGHVEAAVVVEAHVLARGEQHIGRAHARERAAAAVGVHADPAGHEPAHQRAAQVGRVHGERHTLGGEALVDGAQARSRAHHHHEVVGVEVDLIEA